MLGFLLKHLSISPGLPNNLFQLLLFHNRVLRFDLNMLLSFLLRAIRNLLFLILNTQPSFTNDMVQLGFFHDGVLTLQFAVHVPSFLLVFLSRRFLRSFLHLSHFWLEMPCSSLWLLELRMADCVPSLGDYF